MNEKKKGSVGKVILVILLLILFLLGGIYAGYYLTNHNMLKFLGEIEKKETKEKNKTKEVDLNSRVVKFLYNEVSEDEPTPNWSAGWRYAEKLDGPESSFNDYKYSKTDNITMKILGKSISSLPKYEVLLEEAPTINGRRDFDVTSYNSNYTYKIKKEDVERLYKQIFGSNAVLDPSIPIVLDQYSGNVLYYDANSDAYYPQTSPVGGTTGPGGYILKLSKVEKTGNTIKLYQDITEISYKPDENGVINATEENKETIDKGKFIYTFELEDDGMYKFVSREYKSK